jgi:hypothetical protein
MGRVRASATLTDLDEADEKAKTSNKETAND